MSSAADLAYEVLDEVADPRVVDAAKAAVDAGTHRWIFDPDIDGVVGLVSTANLRRALVVVWLEARDFELDLDWKWEAS